MSTHLKGGSSPSYINNGDGTITDSATGLMWQQSYSGKGASWEDALQYAQKLELANFTDWRFPNQFFFLAGFLESEKILKQE